MGPHHTMSTSNGLRRSVISGIVGWTLLTLASAAPPALAGATADDEAVMSGSGSDLSAWQGRSEAGSVVLSRVPAAGNPAGATTAIDVRRGDGDGAWSQVLARLRDPGSWFRVGRTYRMQAYVRDLNASGASMGLLLANRNYLHRPTQAGEHAGFRDSSWHLMSRTFVCTAPAAADTALYFDLPGSGALHWQITAASVREVTPTTPPTVSGPPDRVLSFGGPAGTAPDPAAWSHDTGGGWGKGQLQRYTASTANSAVDGNGHLIITARRDGTAGAHPYTSARLITRGKVEVSPGSYVETSIVAPVGTGVWPALWLLGRNIDDVGWPACGELDVLEVVGSQPTVALSATHQSAQDDPTEDVQYGWDEPGGSVDLGEPLDRAPHIYGVYFDAAMIRFYIDRREHMALSAVDAVTSGRTWPFDRSFFIVVNVAVGGLEDPSATTFPRSMTIGAFSIWQGGTPF
jgi:beta-glucanase (GH16 family)